MCVGVMSVKTRNNKNNVDYFVFVFYFLDWDDPIGEGTPVSLLNYGDHSTHTFVWFDCEYVTRCSMKSNTFCYFVINS